MEEGMNLLDYAKVIWKWRKLMISLACLTLILTVALCVLMPWTYTAITTIIIPQQQGTMLEVLSGAYENMPPINHRNNFGRSKNYSDILKSYSLAEKVVDDLNLYQEYPEVKNKNKLVQKIKKSIKVKESKGMIKLLASSKSPKLASSIANYYILALDDFNKRGNWQFTRRVSEFLRQEIADAKLDLDLAESKLKIFEKESHLVKISQKELKLARLLRDVEVKESVYTMLLQEYEKSRIDEAKEELFFEVLDPAKPPQHPSSPRMVLYPGLALVLGFLMGGVLSFFFEYLEGFGVKIDLPDFDRKVGFKPWWKS